MTCAHPQILRTPAGCVCGWSETPAEIPASLRNMIARQRKLRAQNARESFSDFARYGWHAIDTAKLEWNWHHQALCDHMQWAFEEWRRKRDHPSYVQQCQNFLGNVPPGTAKSRLISVMFPAWVWLHCPSFTFIALSANPDVASRDASLCRDLIESDWYQTWFMVDAVRPRDLAPDELAGLDYTAEELEAMPQARREDVERWQLRQDKEAVRGFANTAGGWRLSRGWNAKVTGLRADCLLIDDPHDADEVNSDVKRKAVIQRWDDAISNRVNDERCSLRIAICQRVHARDWSAHVIKSGEWVVLVLPLLFEVARRCRTPMPVGTDTAGKPIGWSDPRKLEGEVLHPERFTELVIAAKKRKGTRYFLAQYQQRPEDSAGGTFKAKWLRWYKPDGIGITRTLPEGCSDATIVARPLKFDWVTLTVDANFKKTLEGSRVSLQVWGGVGGNFYLLDNVTRAMGLVETIDKIKLLLARWYPEGLLCILVEDKANGSGIIDSLRNAGISGVIEYDPGNTSKEARAEAVSPLWEAGNVFVPIEPEWMHWQEDGDGWYVEVIAFPNGDRDDQVDAMSQLLSHHSPGGDVARIIALSRLS